MKKYVKPDLFYENFEMSQHVATCAWDMSNIKSREECTAIDHDTDPTGEIVLFTVTANCTFTDYEDYCWTNGGAGSNVFNS